MNQETGDDATRCGRQAGNRVDSTWPPFVTRCNKWNIVDDKKLIRLKLNFIAKIKLSFVFNLFAFANYSFDLTWEIRIIHEISLVISWLCSLPNSKCNTNTRHTAQHVQMRNLTQQCGTAHSFAWQIHGRLRAAEITLRWRSSRKYTFAA